MTTLDIRAILEHLPHRYPFLLVDRVLEVEQGKRIVAIKNVTINEPFFTGHFPHLPVMPGVLQIEALAQAAGHSVVPDDGAGLGRPLGLLLRRHRQRALQASGGSRRPAAARGQDRARRAFDLEVQRRARPSTGR